MLIAFFISKNILNRTLSILFFTFFTELNFSRADNWHIFASLQRHTQSIVAFIVTNINKMFKTIILALLIIAISFVLLAITIIIKKNGRFPNIHIGGNKEMRKRGIKCAQSQDRDARKENPMRVSEKSR